LLRSLTTTETNTCESLCKKKASVITQTCKSTQVASNCKKTCDRCGD
jgi:hypothetical protein